MSTPEPAPLAVNLAALDALAAAGGHPTVEHVRTIAAPVVAAELRRLAAVGHWSDDVEVAQFVDAALRARAHVLDPQ